MTREASDLVRKQILFADGGTASLVMPSADGTIDSVVAALGIATPEAIILIFGGATGMSDEGIDRLTQLIEEGLIPVARERRALLIDGGTDSGIMAIVGRVVGDEAVRPPLLGVAPYGLVSFPDKPLTPGHEASELVALEPHHSHFILPPGERWGAETETLIKVAATLARNKDGLCPVVALLINGGKIAREEAYACVQQGWPLIVLEGSGRAADEVAAAYHHFTTTTDARIAEIVEEGNLILFPVSGEPEQLQKLLFNNM